MTTTRNGAAVATARAYYDSSDADRFYASIWGGEDIHVGLYERPDEPIAAASRRTVEAMARALPARAPVAPRLRVVDLGAGYGGAARWLARTLGAEVTCVNLSSVQNRRNRELTAAAGLGAQVRVIDGDFARVPLESGLFDVVWSQDALLHAPDRAAVIVEAARLLAPGGLLVFTDPMQADECPPGVLAPVLARIHLESLGSPQAYAEAATCAGLRWGGIERHTHQLARHYTRVREELQARHRELVGAVSRDYVDRMVDGLGHWIRAAAAGHLVWGIARAHQPG
jgi:sarcosine/dimethylglycine N-methyltransferase